MPSLSRRQALQLCVGTFAATTGCAGETERDGPPDPAESEYTTDAESVSLRASGPDPVLSYPDGEEPEFFELLVTESGAADLTFDREPDGTAAARSFVEATQFDAESLFAAQDRIDECHTTELAYLQQGSDDELPRPRFCRRTRPPDAECSVDAVDTQVAFVRIPTALDDPPRSYGYGSGGSCEPPRAGTEGGQQ